MSAYKLTNILLALFWSFLGLSIFFRGIGSLMSNIHLMPVLLIIFLIIGIAKGVFVIAKYFRNNLSYISNLEDNIFNYLFGWTKVFNFRNLLIMLVMILLGVTCAVLLNKFELPLALGALRIAVGSALMSSSIAYWQEVKKSV